MTFSKAHAHCHVYGCVYVLIDLEFSNSVTEEVAGKVYP